MSCMSIALICTIWHLLSMPYLVTSVACNGPVGEFLPWKSANTTNRLFWCFHRELTVNIYQHATDQAYQRHWTISFWMNVFIFYPNSDCIRVLYSCSHQFLQSVFLQPKTKLLFFQFIPRASFWNVVCTLVALGMSVFCIRLISATQQLQRSSNFSMLGDRFEQMNSRVSSALTFCSMIQGKEAKCPHSCQGSKNIGKLAHSFSTSIYIKHLLYAIPPSGYW